MSAGDNQSEWNRLPFGRLDLLFLYMNICVILNEVTLMPFMLTNAPLSDGMQYFLNTVHWHDAVGKSLKDSVSELKEKVKEYLLSCKVPNN